MSIRAFFILLLAAAALAGCGRRGGLEEPPEPNVSAVAGQPNPAAEAVQSEPAPTPGSGVLSAQQSPAAGTPDQRSPGSQEPAEAVPEDAGGTFILDPLI